MNCVDKVKKKINIKYYKLGENAMMNKFILNAKPLINFKIHIH